MACDAEIGKGKFISQTEMTCVAEVCNRNVHKCKAAKSMYCLLMTCDVYRFSFYRAKSAASSCMESFLDCVSGACG